MHPRNPYNKSPDFSSLSDLFPPLKPYVSLSPSGKHYIDFKHPEAQRVLTQALLKRDFDLTLSLPEDRLCPPVPNRLNYILWVQDLLFPFYDNPPDQEIRGLDIGTGASAIYPLLACSLPNTGKWTFIGTEIDSLSANFASRNVEANNLQSRITIWPIHPNISPTHDVEPSTSHENLILAPLTKDSDSRFDFTMCNPPFYGSTLEIEISAETKDLPPNAVCSGAETEMITPGGETAFVLQMLEESAREDVRARCRWFTSMLGKLVSVGEVVGELRKRKIDNYALTQFIQGTTRRWAVAWSFGDDRVSDTVARPSAPSLSAYIPAPTTLRQTFTITVQKRNSPPFEIILQPSHEYLKATLSQVLASIEGVGFHDVPEVSQAHVDTGLWKLDIEARENTWSRAARRKRKRSFSSSTVRVSKTPRLNPASGENAAVRYDENTVISEVPSLPELQCRISSLPAAFEQPLRTEFERSGSASVTLEAQFVKGKDRALFEGFWSHVCRKIRDVVE